MTQRAAPSDESRQAGAARPLAIAVVAPACRLQPEAAERVAALAADRFGARAPDLRFHPQCFLSDGHFAGSDAARTAAFIEVANDPGVDAVWFARGGYGSCRLDDGVYDALGPTAQSKTYLGYSDMGVILAQLARRGVGTSCHGPMPADINRDGGEAAVARALDFLVDSDVEALEPAARRFERAFAFNITILAHLLGAGVAPDFTDAVLLIEDVDEHLYRIDRALWQITSSANVRRAAGVMLGRVSRIPPNDPAFAYSPEEIVSFWCARAGIPYLGPADIGHDAGNRIVIFARPIEKAPMA